MASNHQISITLPEPLAALVQRKVASGEYADESDVICDSLLLLDEQENDLDRWLREEVVPIALAVEVDPSQCISSSQLREELQVERNGRGQHQE